jgi:hypothetical protein
MKLLEKPPPIICFPAALKMPSLGCLIRDQETSRELCTCETGGVVKRPIHDSPAALEGTSMILALGGE